MEEIKEQTKVEVPVGSIPEPLVEETIQPEPEKDGELDTESDKETGSVA